MQSAVTAKCATSHTTTRASQPQPICGIHELLVFPRGDHDHVRGSPSPSEELLGDILETATGVLVVAARFPDMFDKWGGKRTIEACL